MSSQDSVIVKNPKILSGTPVFRGTRVPFQALLDYLEGGGTLDEFLEDFPSVTREAAIRALEHAKTALVGSSNEDLNKLVEPMGFEPTTSSMPSRRAPNCATAPPVILQKLITPRGEHCCLLLFARF